jgi:hypothetical protein
MDRGLKMTFARFLPKPLIEALASLANQGTSNWWREILANTDLHLAIRGGYLNVYAKGQSVFKVELGDDRRPVMTTHYKYLLKPRMPSGQEYISFDGNKFLVGKKDLDPGRFFQGSYVINETIPELVQAALGYSNPEKAGVHIIAKENSNVVDMEIAFSALREPEDPATSNKPSEPVNKTKSFVQRIDLAALRENGDRKSILVFYEAKRFDDARLWGKKPEVLKQLNDYGLFLQKNEAVLKEAYQNVCIGLDRLRQMKGAKPVSNLVSEVASGKRQLEIDKVCRLIVFGYSGNDFERLKNLEATPALADRVISKGDPKGLKLLGPV